MLIEKLNLDFLELACLFLNLILHDCIVQFGRRLGDHKPEHEDA